jgi:pyruvate formate lyase activating enzyme
MSEFVGRIFNIQKFSLHDGPGIRTVVFLKGCPLGCAWCCNPNSRRLQVLPIRDANDPGVFTEDSRDYEMDEVLKIILQDVPFYEESGGGVTLSGGESLVQHKFSLKLLKRLRALGIHTAIETTGYAALTIFAKALEGTDLVIIDVKHYDRKQHKRWTGVSNELPLRNLAAALESPCDVLVRIPVIPGVNNSLEDAKAFCELLRPMGVSELQLLPFHQLGERKYELLGWDYALKDAPPLHEEDLMDFQQVFADGGIRAYF